MKREEIVNKLVEDRIITLKREKSRLEEQLTQSTGQEIELPEAFEEQRREKLAEIIKELNILGDETLVINIGNINTSD